MSEAEMRDALLAVIRRAGASGVTKSKLDRRPEKLRNAVLAEMIRTRQVRSAKDGRYVRYFLPEFETPVEDLYELIDKQLPERLGPLLVPKDFASACRSAAARANLDAAIVALIKEKRLLQIERGKETFYLHLPAIQRHLDGLGARSLADASGVDGDCVVNAWKRVRARTGYDDVSIHELREAVGIPQERLAAWLLDEARAGRWLLSTGDALHAGEEQRAGAIESNGITFLFARHRG